MNSAGSRQRRGGGGGEAGASGAVRDQAEPCHEGMIRGGMFLPRGRGPVGVAEDLHRVSGPDR